jgi:hypothetical protein
MRPPGASPLVVGKYWGRRLGIPPMALAAGSTILVRMTSRAVTITLELRLAGDELDGRASDGTGDDRSFSGWLGLLVAIDALLNAAPERRD